jgi:hypothetical protein
MITYLYINKYSGVEDENGFSSPSSRLGVRALKKL